MNNTFSFDPCTLIRKKRFGGELTQEEITAFVRGVVDGTFADYQTAAMLMAICIQGMTDNETLALTMAMAHSGDTLDLSAIPGIKADKHSTGGVGDTTSLVLVPLVACCGVKMAKMSGRGLGFTGGTLDKMEAIPGMSVNIDTAAFEKQVTDIGCAIIGQTAQLAPADKVLYALRDVTGTVDCMPLIVSSILSKKIAAGCDVVVLDVKVGSGAIMDTPEKSLELARQMVRIGNMSGKRFSALLTDMDQPLGNYIGNALEVEEAIDILAGRVHGDLRDVSLQLGAHILRNAGMVPTVAEGAALLAEKIDSGEGLAKLAEMIAAQGGDPMVTKDTARLPKAARYIEVKAEKSGWMTAIKTDDLGNAARLLGAGRLKKTDVIDPAAGIVMKKRVGDPVSAGDTLCVIHAGANTDVEPAKALILCAITIAETQPEKKTLIHAVVE